MDVISGDYKSFYSKLFPAEAPGTFRGSLISTTNKNSIFNIPSDLTIDEVTLAKHSAFVNFVKHSLRDFLHPENKDNFKSYKFERLVDQEDEAYFSKVSEEYELNYGLQTVTRRGAIKPQKFSELLTKNSEVIDSKRSDIRFEKMTPVEMAKFLDERLTGLETCASNENKSDRSRRYYSEELSRELPIVQQYKSSNNFGIISDNYQMSEVLYYADYSDEAIANLLTTFRGQEDKIKYLATFLPLSLFIITESESQSSISINEQVFKEYLQSQGGLHKNIQQFVLGFGIDLRKEIFHHFRQVALSLGLQFDPVNHCHDLVDWSIKNNLFAVYLFSQSQSKVFPIRFIIPKERIAIDGTFHVRYTTPFLINDLFQKTKFMGCHLLKYDYETSHGKKELEKRVWFVFTFKVIDDVIYDKLRSNLGFSYHSGKRLTHLNVDLFMNPLESGELMKKTGITHDEFESTYRWFGLRPYIFGNDIQNLFFTKLSKDDPRLVDVCQKLGMKEASIETINTGMQTRYKVVISETQQAGGYLSYSSNRMTYSNTNSISTKYDINTYPKIKLSYSKDLKLLNEPIWGLFYNKCVDIDVSFGYKENRDRYFDTAIFIYPYFFTNEAIHVKYYEKNIKYKFNKYIPITPYFYRGIEIVKIFLEPFLKSHPSLIVSEFGEVPFLCEVLKYYNYKLSSLNFYKQYYKFLLNDFENKNNNFNKLYELLRKMYEFNFKQLPDSIYSLIEIETLIEKSDIIHYGIFNLKYYNNMEKLDNYTNIINIFIGLLVGLKYLKNDGILILDFNAVVNKATADIYLIAKKYFKKTDLYHHEVSNLVKRSGCYGIFRGFKGCPKEDFDKLLKILQEFKEMYPEYPKGLQITDKKIIDKYQMTNVNEYKSKVTNKYIYGFLDIPENDDYYQEIINFNNKRYILKLEFIKRLALLMKLSDQELSKIKVPSQEQITYSIMYCKKWGIEYFPYYYDSKVMNDKMGQQILTEIYGNIEPVIYKFKTSLPRLTQKISYNLRKTKKSLKKMQSSKKISEFHSLGFNFMQEITNINNVMVQTGYMIDSRRDFDIKDPKRQLYNYFMANVLFRFYKSSGDEVENNLSFMVRDKIHRNVSQAWLKLYEILAEIDIIPKQKSVYKTFHLCEAPGSFIDCLDYYIKKETNIKSFIWNAQSHKPTKGKKYFGDDYGIIKAYPNRWHWGKDGNGDITSCNNIFSYKELCKDIDLITSDCGLPMNEPGYHRVLFSSMVAITYLLPKDGNMIFKILLPIDISIIWDLIYLWFNNFKEFIFFKPVQNHQSREFYIIGKKYSGKLENTKILNQLLDLVKDSRDTFMTTDLFEGNYSELFISQMLEISQKLCDNWTFTIQKQIYYSDNMDSLDKSFKKKAKIFINQKNLDFIEKYNLVKIENNK